MMKKIITLFILLPLISLAQEITIAEPEFDGQIFNVQNGNEAIELEEKLFYVKKGASVGRMMTGIGKVKARIVIDGRSSPVKIKKAEKLFFVCNYNSSNRVLPSKVIQCVKFTPREKTREFVMSAASNVSGQTNSNQLILEPFKARKYGNYSYLVEFTDLAVGEYGFSIGGDNAGKQVYLFSVVE